VVNYRVTPITSNARQEKNLHLACLGLARAVTSVAKRKNASVNARPFFGATKTARITTQAVHDNVFLRRPRTTQSRTADIANSFGACVFRNGKTPRTPFTIIYISQTHVSFCRSEQLSTPNQTKLHYGRQDIQAKAGLIRSDD
jgi:hypothetical protein